MAQTIDQETGEIQALLVPYSGDEVEQAAQRLANATAGLDTARADARIARAMAREAQAELAAALAAWVTARAGQEAGA